MTYLSLFKKTGKWQLTVDNSIVRTKRIVNWILSIALCLLPVVSNAQFYPVQVTPQLIPPYSVYLSDYATPGTEKLRVIAVQKDLTQPSYQIRLVMSVEWNGRVIMRTSRAFNPAPINLSAGIPTIISGAELAPYLDSRNIDFIGYDRNQYERTKSLPEGSYQLIFTAYDYRRQDVQVSNTGTSFYYLAKSEPPLINFPACGTTLPLRQPQQIIFSWLPRNTASPNSASRTLYEFALYETRPEGRNPNDVVLSTQPVFKTTTEVTQLIYGPAEPLLLENMKYVWRVRATDENGRDAFRNNGFSEVCTFTYRGIDPTFNIGVVQNLEARGETERRASITWTKGDYDSYKIFYRKTGSTSYEWFSGEVAATAVVADKGEYKLYDLEPDTEYETRVQVKKSGVLGPYSEIIKFRTTPLRVAQCGDAQQLPLEGGNPFRNMIRGTIIDVDGVEMTILSASSAANDGWYAGYATVNPRILGGASYTVKFDRLYVREDRTAGFGRIDMLTKGVAAMVEEQLAAQDRRQEERQQQENREQWEGTIFHEKIFAFNETVIDTVYTDPNNNLVVVGTDGQPMVVTEIPAILANAPEKAVIIQDKNGDQWVVQRGENGTNKVTKVEGGGLPPLSGIPVSDDDIDLLKKSLTSLKRDYDDNRIEEFRNDFDLSKKALTTYREAIKNEIVKGTSSTPIVPLATSDAILLPAETIAPSGDEFSTLSIQYKAAEKKYNRSKVVGLLTRDTNTRNEYKLIVQQMQINDQPFNQYVTKRKSEGTKEADLIGEIKTSVISLIDKILDNN
jgi:hypothetical protein